MEKKIALRTHPRKPHPVPLPPRKRLFPITAGLLFQLHHRENELFRPLENACLDTFEVYTFFPDTSTSKDLTVITSCNEFENRGSGWEFQDVLKNELKIAIYKPLAAASYIPLPPKLIKKKACR
ncbi:hypothetical protein TNCV_4853861 [Trichonephila clavipes]|nr:hypothetical protein TNCV_4853861 [Trichonephila clavipes]